MVLILRTGIPYREGGSDRPGVQLGLNGARRPDLFSMVELVALRRVAPRPAAQRLPANRAVRASRSAAARGGVVAARQPLPLNRYRTARRGCPGLGVRPIPAARLGFESFKISSLRLCR